MSEKEDGYHTIKGRKVGKRLTYEHLHSLPCLLLLCDKGRMGDTFPPSFDCLDLRIRTSDNLQTLIQELGRLCRYPYGNSSAPRPLLGPDAWKDIFEGRCELAIQKRGSDGGDETFVGYAADSGSLSALLAANGGYTDDGFEYKRVLSRSPYALLLGSRMKKLEAAVEKQRNVNAQRKLLQLQEVEAVRCIRLTTVDTYIKKARSARLEIKETENTNELWDFTHLYKSVTGGKK
eukprot:1358030-Prymnesium_polylepis.1